MPIKSIITICVFYFVNGPFCDILEMVGISKAWIGFIDYSILFVSFLLIHSSIIKNEYESFKLEIDSLWKFFVEIIGIMVISYIFVNLLVILSSKNGLDILPQNTENLKESSNDLPKILTFLMMVVYAPLIEELVFRHAMIAWPRKDNKKYIRIMSIISVFAFDMIHVIHIEEFLYYLPLSIGLTSIYLLRNRNIFSSIIAHSLTNLVGFLLILLNLL